MANSQAGETSLKVSGLSHRFGYRQVLNGIDFRCSGNGSLCVTGPNGSGKSTLLRIVAGLLSPSAGKVEVKIDGEGLKGDALRRHLRLVSPESSLYDELTGFENLRFLSKVSGFRSSREKIESRLESVGLGGRGKDLYGSYSSGMKQRLKLAAALLTDPRILLLDEPSSNLDDDGCSMVYDIIKEQSARSILVFATNDEREVKLGEQIVRLD